MFELRYHSQSISRPILGRVQKLFWSHEGWYVQTRPFSVDELVSKTERERDVKITGFVDLIEVDVVNYVKTLPESPQEPLSALKDLLRPLKAFQALK